tara:strand:+ start:1779 stop:2609 length:831 start_codon:yes stop_codon:yes gene_type:complete
MSIFGIVCPNYGTSTVFGSTLTACSEVFHIGESHKIFTKNIETCRECGENCPVITPELIETLKAKDSNHLYRTLSDELPHKFIVTGDKNPYFYDKVTSKPDEVIVLLKNPIAHVFSFYRRELNVCDEVNTEVLKEATIKYYDEILKRIHWVNSNYLSHKQHWVFADGYFNSYPASVKKLCSQLFNTSEVCTESINERNHYIGGNHRVSKGGNARSFFNNEFKVDDRYKKFFSESEISMILELTSKFRELKELCSQRGFDNIMFSELLVSFFEDVNL